VPILTLPHKLQRLFQFDYPYVDDLRITPVWVVGEVLNYGEDFNKYITSNKLQKQEGMIFRHLLRFVMLIDEMAELCPPDVEHEVWQSELWPIANQLEAICRKADPRSSVAGVHRGNGRKLLWLGSVRFGRRLFKNPHVRKNRKIA